MHGSSGPVHAACVLPPLLVFLSSLTTPVGAQQLPLEPPRVEVWGAAAAAPDVVDGEVVSAYAPPLVAGTVIASRASQVLVVDPGVASGFEAGINAFMTPRLGVQALVGVVSADVSGRNGPYQVSLRYETRQPPDNLPQEFEVGSSTPWPDTTGTIRTTWWAVGAVARWWTSGRAGGGTVAAGLGFERHGGEIESLGYTSYRLGGHGVLFPSDHRVVMTPSGSGTIVRPYLRADVHRRVAARLGLVVGARLHLGTTREIPVRVERLVDPADSPIVPALGDVERDLGQPALTLSGAQWQIAAGVKLFY